MWIILESYVYVHKTACEAILYNTLNYVSYCTGNEYELCLIEQLLENVYSIHLNDEVVRLDTKYIRNWSLTLDIKILVKTVLVVLFRKGSR